MPPGGTNPRTRRLPNHERRKLDNTTTSLERIGRTVNLLTPVIAELWIRDAEQVGPDGYPASVGGSSESTTTTRNIRSSTETAAMRLAQYGLEPDVIHDVRVDVDIDIRQIDLKLLTLLSRVTNALRLGETNRGRQSTVTVCANPYCQRIIPGTERDRPRGGRCDTAGHWCYRNWRRDGLDRKPNGGEAA